MVKNLLANEGDVGSIPGSERSPGEGNDNAFPEFLPGKSHRKRGPVGYSPWGCKESDTTEKLTLLLLDAAQTKQPEIVLSADQKCVQPFLPFGKLPFSCTYV